jgi:hypothetical protein
MDKSNRLDFGKSTDGMDGMDVERGACVKVEMVTKECFFVEN